MRVVKRVVSFRQVFFSEVFAARSVTECSGGARASGAANELSARGAARWIGLTFSS